MVRRTVQLVATSALALASISGVRAAEPEPAGEEPVLVHTDDILPDEVERRGAYVRFDVGGMFSPSPGVSIVDAPPGVASVGSGSLDGQASFGAGVGYRFSNWFRSDVSVVHAPGRDFDAPTTGVAGGTGTVSGSLSSTAILASAYAEFAPESWVRPYVGAGLGTGNLSINSAVETLPSGGQRSYGDHSDWTLAWSLAAGVTMDISERIELDAGYRYVNFGEAESGVASDGSRLSLDTVETHEIRFGMHFLFR
ncbi:outer membrane protein [Amorphus sp. 3PC139-8]|uniref:outer membrane protein n=1 Tax=Amorphus sp. 3PC139-8 TaxID=2735676 RepID=UPI00345DF042